MPYKFETKKQKIPRDNDRRVKLSEQDRDDIKALYGKISQRKLAKMFGVSRRLIVFVGNPESYEKNLKAREERGGSSIYYNKEKNTKTMKKYRQYKKSLYDKQLLDEEK